MKASLSWHCSIIEHSLTPASDVVRLVMIVIIGGFIKSHKSSTYAYVGWETRQYPHRGRGHMGVWVSEDAVIHVEDDVINMMETRE